MTQTLGYRVKSHRSVRGYISHERGLFNSATKTKLQNLRAAKRCNPTFQYERIQWEKGLISVVGVDEVGRGAVAGPVVAAACLLSPSMPPQGLRDSKCLTEAARKRLFEELMKEKIPYGLCFIDADEIDRINVHNATLKAMGGAVDDLQEQHPELKLDYVLIDGKFKPEGIEVACQTIVRGDAQSYTIAAASIIAKVKRDQQMRHLDQQFPQYGFAKHKGYATPKHVKALQIHGPSPVHRMKCKPLKQSVAAMHSETDASDMENDD